MLEGCDALADAAQVTLGPKGRNVLIDQGYEPVIITKDGKPYNFQIVCKYGSQFGKMSGKQNSRRWDNHCNSIGSCHF